VDRPDFCTRLGSHLRVAVSYPRSDSLWFTICTKRQVMGSDPWIIVPRSRLERLIDDKLWVAAATSYGFRHKNVQWRRRKRDQSGVGSAIALSIDTHSDSRTATLSWGLFWGPFSESSLRGRQMHFIVRQIPLWTAPKALQIASLVKYAAVINRRRAKHVRGFDGETRHFEGFESVWPSSRHTLRLALN
jgi:hypothetical protein